MSDILIVDLQEETITDANGKFSIPTHHKKVDTLHFELIKDGYVMGSEPPQDPLAEVSQSSLTVTSTDDIRWNDRGIKDSWIRAIGVVLFLIGAVFIVPQLVIIAAAIGAILVYALAAYLESREGVDPQSGWARREVPDLHLVEEEKYYENRYLCTYLSTWLLVNTLMVFTR